ncbi:MAG: hypothetical protein SFU86_18730, partial [Pirellulaceae bacterium]|nr:hypothetical protein [Pirellulaceae bacterium]
TADRDPREVYNTRIAELLRNDPAAKAEFDRDYPPIEYCSLNGVTKIPVVENDYYLRRMAAATCAPAGTPAASQKSRASTPAQPTPARDYAPPAADAKPAAERTAERTAARTPERTAETAREPIAELDREPIVPLTRQQRRARERQLKHKLRQRG